MKKEIMKRSLIGFPIGITIGQFITILISLKWGNGDYSPYVPELVSAMGSEIHAIILQSILCGILGMGFAAASFIWQIDHWSIVRQTGIYFLTMSIIMLPIAYFAYWMEHSLVGFLSYFGVFVFIFVILWVITYVMGRYNVKRMNGKLQQTNDYE